MAAIDIVYPAFIVVLWISRALSVNRIYDKRDRGFPTFLFCFFFCSAVSMIAGIWAGNVIAGRLRISETGQKVWAMVFILVISRIVITVIKVIVLAFKRV